MSLERDGVPLPAPRGRKSWAVLARLARATAPIPRHVLAEELFDEADDPLGALRWTLTELRRAVGLPEAFRGDPLPPLSTPGLELDVGELARGRLPEPWPEGRFLEGLDAGAGAAFAAWLAVERHRVDGELLAALRQHTLKAISARDAERAVSLAGAMVRRAPYEEGHHVLLVKALAESGDAEAAARQAEASERLFARELGVTASPAIRAAARPSVAGPVPGIGQHATATSLCEAGLAALAAGAADAGIECLRGATHAAERARDARLLARCLIELGTALVHAVRGYDDEGAVMLSAGLERASAAGDAALAAKAYSELAYTDLQAGRRISAAQNLAAAEGLAGEDLSLRAAIAGFAAMNLHDGGDPAAAAEGFGQALELSRSAGAARREAWVLGLGARSLYTLGRLEEAAEWAQGSCRVASSERWTAFRPWPEAWMGHIGLVQGRDPVDVREAAEATFVLARQIQDPCWEGLAAKTVGLTHLATGDPVTALAWMENAAALCRRVTDSYHWLDVEILLAVAGAAWAAGRTEHALDAAQRALALAAQGSMEAQVARGQEFLARSSGAA
ncbi:AfsR/SARP family transcriptional regulator [Sinomonas halotolerans]|uniref:Tetratricopeptide repeat protein n=1 Tax=Sinomonas halotolerans TaxID=1644133 RepID=A0ABU9X2B1_9MICC